MYIYSLFFLQKLKFSFFTTWFEGMTMAEAKMLTVGTMVEKVDGSDSDRTVCKVPRVKTSTGKFGITGLFGGRRVNLPQDWKVKSKK